MCEPVTLAMVGAGATIGGGIYKGVAARNAAQANAGILQGNANIAEAAAGDANARGSVTEGRVRMAGTATQAHQKEQLAGSGVDVQSGSALDVLSSTAMMTELDAQIARSNAAREAWGYRTQARQFRRQAQNQRDAGDAQLIGSILGGVSGAASYGSQVVSIGGPSSGGGYGAGGFQSLPIS